MALYEYEALKTEYKNFLNPVAVIRVDDKRILENKKGFIVSDIYVDITSDYEASVAEFVIYSCYDETDRKFMTQELKPYITLGSQVSIAMGYSSKAKQVFVGFISNVEFMYNPDGLSGVKVCCMDAKGIMMMNGYCRQLASNNYSDAINEILQKSTYVKLQSNGILNDLNISATSDKAQANIQSAGSQTIEMVSESDYEFMVRAAKRFNYEFFIDNGRLIFGKAKEREAVLIDINPYVKIKNMSVHYDCTGILGSISVRGTDIDKAKLVEAKVKNNNKISIGGKAKSYVKNNQRTYVDATIRSQADANNRAAYLMEEVSYHFGTLELELRGLPELKPGYFIEVADFGEAVSNKFYVVHVVHTLSSDFGYTTKVTGKADRLQ